MPYSHLNDYPAPVREPANRLRLACFDVDGTLTDGRLFFDSEGRELKAFHVHDGQGLVLLRKAGIAVAFVTARASTLAEQRARELAIVEVHTAVADKLACVRDMAARLGIGMEEVAFMGDDLPDLRVMQQVGFDQRGRATGGFTSAIFAGEFVSPLIVLALTAGVATQLPHALLLVAIGQLLLAPVCLSLMRHRRAVTVAGAR